MKKQILISRTLGEIRIAVVEDGTLAELQVERNSSSLISGNIYKARVLNSSSAIRASFVDIGEEKAGIVSWKDIHTENGPRGNTSPAPEGSDLIVQAVKEPVSGKGPRMKARVSLVGKYVILSSDSDRTSLSKRIGSGARGRVGKILDSIRPENMGLIARTAALDKDSGLIEKEVKSLKAVWDNIVQTSRIMPSPSLLYREPPVYLSAVRDFASPNDEIIADDWEVLADINSYIDENFPGEKNISIGYHYSGSPLFRDFGMEPEIENLLKRKVHLKSGGDMIIEEAEGLTVIDVNTGAGTGGGSGALLRTNLEAAAEAARQIRLRNLVGIIVIDFIDMGHTDMKKVSGVFEQEMKNDRTSHTISEMSEFCVLQLTRKRSRESVAKTLSEPCAVCEGTGLVKSKKTVCYEIIREMDQHNLIAQGGEIRVRAHREVIDTMKSVEAGLFEGFERKGVNVVCEETDDGTGEFSVTGEWKV